MSQDVVYVIYYPNFCKRLVGPYIHEAICRYQVIWRA